MARIDHTFSVDKPPDVAQAMFVRDIAPDLARDRGFEITRERPGELVFSDGTAPGSDVDPDFEESAPEPQDSQEREASGTVRAPMGPSEPPTPLLDASFVSDDIPALLARHIHVDFSAQGAGTRVRVHGHVERDIRHGLELLGTPQHWPEIADQPHD